MSDRSAPVRLLAVLRARAALLGVLGAVLLMVGGAGYQAVVTPPYRFIDEQAHVGYVLAVQDGTLPTIDTPIDAAAGGRALRERLAIEPERRRDVWVANNPPLTYLLAAGPSAATRALGLPGGALLGLRLVNVAAAGGAVALTYLLARRLGGGSVAVGLVAAGLVAASPHLGFVAALAFNDGMALLATTGIAWALARLAEGQVDRRADRRAVAALGLWCAFGAAVRPMALVVAVVAAALGLAIATWRRPASFLTSAAWLGLPAAVTSGWFYVLNVRRYGDPTASDALFEKFLREPNGTLVESLRTTGVWDAAYRTLTTRRLEQTLPDDPMVRYRIALWLTALGLLLTVVLLVWSTVADLLRRRRAPEADGSRSQLTPSTSSLGGLGGPGRLGGSGPPLSWSGDGAVDPDIWTVDHAPSPPMSDHRAVAPLEPSTTATAAEGPGPTGGRLARRLGQPRLALLPWATTAVLSVLPVVLTAQHRSGGGAPHPRYLLPILPLLATVLALPVVRLAGRLTGAALVAVVAAATLERTRASARWLVATPTGPLGTELVAPYGTSADRAVIGAVAAVGLALVLVALALARDRTRRHPGPGRAPRAPAA